MADRFLEDAARCEADRGEVGAQRFERAHVRHAERKVVDAGCGDRGGVARGGGLHADVDLA
ncbi:MAG: hypothetical protein HOV66_00445 [Streptomycetaceae bacterium]|nr:hypothetical protein [Streptomycetaceae bacterium]NUS53322.1 hypothetical protein [Streptomycetaceae bacterium]